MLIYRTIDGIKKPSRNEIQEGKFSKQIKKQNGIELKKHWYSSS